MLEGGDMNLFADDSINAPYRVHKSTKNYSFLQDDINSVSNVISAKYVQLNKSKSRTLLIMRMCS